jgi:hypothetical protein
MGTVAFAESARKKNQKTMSDLPFHIVWAVDTHL